MSLLVIVVLVFLFWGDPDVWDVLHAKVMSMAPETQCPKPAAQKPEPKKGLGF